MQKSGKYRAKVLNWQQCFYVPVSKDLRQQISILAAYIGEMGACDDFI